MTEDEAKKRWCPFSRIVGHTDKGGMANIPENQAAFNRLMDRQGAAAFIATPANCIASKCMAWRWHLSGARDPDLPRQFPHVAQEKFDKMEGGYCGLAGKP